MLRYFFLWTGSLKLSRRMTKPTKWHVRPAKTQISLGIHPVWSESSLYAQWVAKDSRFLHADSEDSDQTGRMPRLIWVFAGRTDNFVGCFHATAQIRFFRTYLRTGTSGSHVAFLRRVSLCTGVTCRPGHLCHWNHKFKPIVFVQEY